VIGPHIKGSPIVLLLGCTTANAKVAFQSVAAAFESRGEAGIIVATSNLIYGPKAVDVAEMFLKQVAAVQDGQTFGDVMLAVRRAALADGIAMILCLSAYGDADWKLVRN
jgi:formaldehyde-activating enzyme involved in methanogenesis